jgi:hypothetical protein
MITQHPDTLQDYHRLKQIRLGSKQAIEDKAIEAYHKALDEGSREEAVKEYFKHFNNNHGQQEHTGVSVASLSK